jgi:hypothetical protein
LFALKPHNSTGREKRNTTNLEVLSNKFLSGKNARARLTISSCCSTDSSNNNNNGMTSWKKASSDKKKGPPSPMLSRGDSGLGPTPTESLPRNKKDFPVFQSNAEISNLHPPSSNNDTLYSRYKWATRNFKLALQNAVPAEIFKDDNVVALMNAAEYVAAHFSAVDETIMNDLKLAIRFRQRVANSVYGGGDDGHSHFIAVLSYCWACLCPLERKKKERRSSSQPSLKRSEVVVVDEVKPENRFAALVVDDCDEVDDEEDLPSANVVRPAMDEMPHAMTLEQLASAEDRIDAVFFLMTIDELMGHNCLWFRKLKEAYLYGKRCGLPETHIIGLLMEAATAVNFSIQQVASLEQELWPNIRT